MAAPASAALPSFSYRLLWELILTAGTSELHTKQLLNDCWCNEVTPDLYWFWFCHSELQTTAMDMLLLTWPRTADARAATPRNGRAEQQNTESMFSIQLKAICTTESTHTALLHLRSPSAKHSSSASGAWSCASKSITQRCS